MSGRELLQGKALVNQRRSYDGATSLYIASSKGPIEVIKLLLMGGADPSIEGDDKESPTSLLAALNNHIEIMKELLLDAATNPNVPNDRNLTPLFLAAEKNETEMVNLLLQFGARPNQANEDGATPIFIAAQAFSKLLKFCLHKK